MIVDCATPDRAAFAGVFDVCVIGAGPAGITLARGLGARGLRVALMEAGGLEWSPESQDAYRGEVVGHDYHDLDGARLRFFGGTSSHWNGLCRPLDPEDFAPNPANPGSGWPIGLAELAPYCAEADRILDIRPEPETPVPAGAAPGAPFRPAQFFRSAPTRFGEKYRDELAASATMLLGLQANLVDLRLDPDLKRVGEAVFRAYDPGDPGFAVRARFFALCTGGIENARLLLNFRSQRPQGIGNDHGLVGRFFADHPALHLGEVILAETPAVSSQFFTPTRAFIAEQCTLGMTLRIDHRVRKPRSAIEESIRSVKCALPFAERLAEAVLGAGVARCDTGGWQDYAWSRDPERYPWGLVSTNVEQALNPHSRVTLSEERDAFGLLRPRLDWRVSPVDRFTLRATTLAFAGYLADSGLGRMRVYDWLLAADPELPRRGDGLGHVGSWHHMGTTRMSEDPRQGVVDATCRVHGTANLYVGGSSVFASTGFANPTYTIVQLALRLGDHLGETGKA